MALKTRWVDRTLAAFASFTKPVSEIVVIEEVAICLLTASSRAIEPTRAISLIGIARFFARSARSPTAARSRGNLGCGLPKRVPRFTKDADDRKEVLGVTGEPE